MSEIQESVNLDNLDCTNVKTGMTILAAGLVQLKVTKMEEAPNKKGTGNNLTIEFALERAAKSVDGEEVQPGFPIYDTVSLVPTEKYDPRKRIAEFQEASVGQKLPKFKPFEQYIGKIVMAKVKVESSEEYGDKNRISYYVKKA